jgi:hypothetical protein
MMMNLLATPARDKDLPTEGPVKAVFGPDEPVYIAK